MFEDNVFWNSRIRVLWMFYESAPGILLWLTSQLAKCSTTSITIGSFAYLHQSLINSQIA